ncbi:MAG: ABC transporter ATP-binding protein [Myxococcales bacterium]|nr:ABC transporter ATP-binding protein [Myxococcales bacterium]MCB9521149.1 ABC transporter ATP-binding protein [Myxococcales bacterium]MCB9530175.1 ABC transporter ATP-binding protein [Myxococcales bacterium]MCB9534159.1 ABC transporter ATP-binding protein [Myxococcales bacterium]
MTTDTPAIEARGLSKRYGDLVAVDGIDFTIPRGEAFGFLGPNGAGKSTTMRMIYRASPVGGGELRILGLDATSGRDDRAIKARLGVIHQEDNLDQELTVRETLEVFCRFHRLRGAAAAAKVDELLDFADLRDRADSLVITLSGGMKRRLMVARGLIGDPDVVVLDEPTTGLDPRARQSLWDKLSRLKRRSATLILTTHYMDEAERLCDRVAIMDKGRIVTVGAPRDLIERHASPSVIEVELADAESAGAVEALERTAEAHASFGGRLLLYTRDGEATMAAALAALGGRPAHLRRGTLEDVFLRITGRGLDG